MGIGSQYRLEGLRRTRDLQGDQIAFVFNLQLMCRSEIQFRFGSQPIVEVDESALYRVPITALGRVLAGNRWAEVQLAALRDSRAPKKDWVGGSSADLECSRGFQVCHVVFHNDGSVCLDFNLHPDLFADSRRSCRAD